VFVCAPTTPIGVAISIADLRAIADSCEAIGGLLVLDQSYDAFAERPLGTPALPNHSAVLHIRSLTKEYALAGLRVGFAIGPVPVIDALNRARVPWSVSTGAQAAAVAAMTDRAYDDAMTTVSALCAEAARLRDACARLGFATLASTTHYFVARVRDAAAVRRILLDRAGICVRDCTSFDMPQHIRVAARTRPENDALLLSLGITELDKYRTMSGRPTPPEAQING
jgi:histidinol-phosphate/aromatic aminotransferase/cobyric acid decarboxylase-like protein